MKFFDEATITVRSGKGGNGCVAFRRERYIPKGGPCGGDGGKGGDLILRGSSDLLSLYDFRLKRVYDARNGMQGQGSDKYGKAADDTILDLPIGTLVYEVYEDGSEKLLADLTKEGKQVVICKGGDGGRGNIHFKSSVNQTPRQSEDGFPGEEKRLRLQLKIIADIGLLGLPNAGKSTFISKISAAKPKIAAYPFTTLVPNLGVIEDYMGNKLIIADIPGLIEGASTGLGLGHRFLKHVERTRFLVHILSAADLSLDDPFEGFNMLDEELRIYDKELAEKTQLRVINKIDLLSEEDLATLKEKAKEANDNIYFISALHKDGVDLLLKDMWDRFNTMNQEEKDEQDEQQA
ncbi:GTPase ObgE [Maridesulfovibrio ferrireducens]|uniref:GTPase ObgE n=1 Tax=Maridesulfovibrio ferrireducens TaxID=246191 RepID=UPI001A2677DC|nr:GTPase ObgE [Maridesulfovibrio ferrireducens]MBI9109857.1 GTPase ObgE [Maridesulfovibrio ferrireducens]